MKRKISILLSLILLVSSSGLMLDKHYCNGKLVNIFLLPHSGACCDASMPMDENSCNDEFFGFLLDVPFEFPAAKIMLTISDLDAQLTETLFLIDSKVLNQTNQELAFSSPPLSNIKIYLRVESFLN